MGSNQVDFGGMTFPASATAIICPSVGGVKGKGNGEPLPVDESLEFPHPPDPADELDPRIGPRVPDPEDRTQDPLLEKGDVETGDGVVLPEDPIPGLEAVPEPAQVHPEGVGHLRGFLGKACRNKEIFTGTFQKELFCQIAQVPNGAVVIHDPELIV